MAVAACRRAAPLAAVVLGRVVEVEHATVTRALAQVVAIALREEARDLARKDRHDPVRTLQPG